MDMEKKDPQAPGCVYNIMHCNRTRYNENVQVDGSRDKSFKQVVYPLNGVNSDSPLSFLHIKARVEDCNGKDFGLRYVIILINYFLITVWRSMKARVNGRAINLTAPQNSGYKALIQAYTTVDLSSCYYLLHRSTKIEVDDYRYKNQKLRHKILRLRPGNNKFEMCEPIAGCHFLLSDTYIAPNNSFGAQSTPRRRS